jgi:hypothetical protein
MNSGRAMGRRICKLYPAVIFERKLESDSVKEIDLGVFGVRTVSPLLRIWREANANERMRLHSEPVAHPQRTLHRSVYR